MKNFNFRACWSFSGCAIFTTLLFLVPSCVHYNPDNDTPDEESTQENLLKAYADANSSFNQSDYGDAIKFYRLADSFGLKHPYLYFKMGVSQLNTDDYESSIVNLTKSINSAPENTELTEYFLDLE